MGRLIRFLLLVAGALAAWSLWLAEVCWVKSWAGLAWLSGFNWSALPICALIIIMSSYSVSEHAGWPERKRFVTFGFILTIIAFGAARWAVFELFSGIMFTRVGFEAAIVIVAAGLTVSVGLTVSANRWLAPLYGWTGILVAVALMLVLPLSFVTIKALPALNGSTDQIHSIKMGYPVFWTALLIPLALRLGRKKHSGHR
jgi:hypothetical protein